MGEVSWVWAGICCVFLCYFCKALETKRSEKKTELTVNGVKEITRDAGCGCGRQGEVYLSGAVYV